jgi:hypothetical protein
MKANNSSSLPKKVAKEEICETSGSSIGVKGKIQSEFLI